MSAEPTPLPQARALPFVLMMMLQVANLGFSPLVPTIQKEFALSFSQAGLFAGMCGLISMFVGVPACLINRLRWCMRRMMLRATLAELLKRARISGVTGDIVMTRGPEWECFPRL